jgi:steroid 5-alpha reductase family enzyme
MHGLLVWMGQGTAAVAVLMFILWLLHFPLRNAAIVDVGRAMGLALLAMIYALHGEGYWRRTLLLTAMAVIWGLRLAFHLLLTRVNGQPEEGRYAELRRKWGSHIGLKFLLFFEAQALLCGVLSLPFLLAMHDPAKSPLEFENTLENSGAAIWLVAFLGEMIADAQLARFKRDPKSKGRVCNIGLWRYSRHPNYFFEWLIWVSFAVVAFPAKYGYLGLISPLLMFFFLLRVATDEQALRSKGDAYRKYQKSTSAFVPWFPS